ncbi:DUF2815 family protein [Proteinivorax tanatarense]|uniref:DUF2815 family protein n=1 Tax=Proteinivorax tanatarense TaxID=1260629 RepID=A0AAU7VHL1_9FIRM
MKKNTKVVVPGRFSFANIWEPKSINGSDPKYSISLIIPKSNKKTVAAIKKAIEEAKKEGMAKFGGKVPANLKTPLRDGDVDRADDPNYNDCYFINANSKTAPQIVDGKIQPILERSEVYSGCFGKVSLNFYAFNTNGNRGIAAGLGNVQKLQDGEPLGGSSRAEDDFEIEEDDDFLQ